MPVPGSTANSCDCSTVPPHIPLQSLVTSWRYLTPIHSSEQLPVSFSSRALLLGEAEYKVMRAFSLSNSLTVLTIRGQQSQVLMTCISALLALPGFYYTTMTSISAAIGGNVSLAHLWHSRMLYFTQRSSVSKVKGYMTLLEHTSVLPAPLLDPSWWEPPLLLWTMTNRSSPRNQPTEDPVHISHPLAFEPHWEEVSSGSRFSYTYGEMRKKRKKETGGKMTCGLNC